MSDNEEIVSIRYELPTDHDGFIRRQCSTCDRQFKWHAGPANEEAEQHPDADVYYCPLCGSPAESGDWLTAEQQQLIEAELHRAAMPVIDGMLDSFFDRLKSPGLTVQRTGHLETPDAPNPLVEADDLVIVTSPCHAYEPIKAPKTGRSRFIAWSAGSPSPSRTASHLNPEVEGNPRATVAGASWAEADQLKSLSPVRTL